MILTNRNSINFTGKCTLSNYKACLKGGAIGDALGWPVEFKRIQRIKKAFGEKGIQDLVISASGKAEITDDTQMTMFTADGIIKAIRKTFDLNKVPDMNTVFNSYKLWLNTQNYFPKIQFGKGWISELKDLYVMRAPGTTCTSAVQGNIAGSIERPINNSSGCGGVMRVAPVGLMYKENPKLAFEIGARCAALTHGNPQGYLPAGFLSSTIAHIITGDDVTNAVNKSIDYLKQYKGHETTLKLINKAIELSNKDIEPLSAIEQLGEGWVGHEAIAISVYSALKEPNNFEKAVQIAVNHSGDSDSTGAIVGNILGAHLGMDRIPSKWANKTELTKELEILAKDLFVNPKEIQDAEKRYPI